MEKKSKNTIIISIVALAIVLITVTYAYFSARITGLESASTISLTAGTMTIHYTEGNEEVVLNNIYPRDEEWITKTFTLTGNNTTAIPMDYQAGLEITTNTFKGGQLSFSLEVGQNNDGISMTPVTNKAIVGSNRTMLIGSGSFPGSTTNGVQTYTLKIYFLDIGKNQNINQGATFNAKITVGDKGSIVAVNECIDEVHPTLTQGDEYVNGQYTYKYKKRYNPTTSQWNSITDDGWGVILTDKTSTDPVTTPLCTRINGKPIVRMSGTFDSSVATSIDLSSFETSHVTSMYGMFWDSAATSLDLSSFDTSNVTDMDYMFDGISATTLNLSGLDTSSVTSMAYMFAYSAVTALDLSSFNTSDVTDMDNMFHNSAATSLDLSSFDTTNVSNMSGQFQNSIVTILDLSSFDTSNTTYMNMMFADAHATIGYARTQADANKFNTSLNKPATLTFVVKP